jgi:hypothetical protein
MTVQELLNRLEAVKDKELPVMLVEWSIQNPLMAKHELTTNRMVVQAHRVSIIVD